MKELRVMKLRESVFYTVEHLINSVNKSLAKMCFKILALCKFSSVTKCDKVLCRLFHSPCTVLTVGICLPLGLQRDCQWPLKNGKNFNRSRQPTILCNMGQSQPISRPTNHKRMTVQLEAMSHTPLKFLWASYQIRIIVGCACAGNAANLFSTTSKASAS